MNADEFLSVPNRIAEEAKSVVLPDAVVKAATRVCSAPAFLARLREHWQTLKWCALHDAEPGAQQSGIPIVRKNLKDGYQLLKNLAEWLDRDSSGSLSLMYWRGFHGPGASLDNDSFEDSDDILRADIEAVKRMFAYAALEHKLMCNEKASKRELLFPKSLAKIMHALSISFSLPKPSLSDFGSEVKLMAAIAIALGVNLSQEAARKALTKAMNETD